MLWCLNLCWLCIRQKWQMRCWGLVHVLRWLLTLANKYLIDGILTLFLSLLELDYIILSE